MISISLPADIISTEPELRITAPEGVVSIRFVVEGIVLEIQDVSGNRILNSWASYEEIKAGIPIANPND